MSNTVTCDGCMITKPSQVGFLQMTLPAEEGARRDEFGFPNRTRWDACGPECARVLVDRFESQAETKV